MDKQTDRQTDRQRLEMISRDYFDLVVLILAWILWSFSELTTDADRHA